MSQIYLVSDAVLPPDVLTSLKVDTSETLPTPNAAAGTITPQTHIISLQGDNGIITSTDPAQPGLGMIRFARAATTTTDATPTTLLTFTIPTGYSLAFQVLVAGLDQGSGDGCGGYTTAFVKNVAGTAALVVAPSITNAREGTVITATFTTTCTGANFVISVIGVAGRTIKWGCCVPGITINVINEVV